MGYQEDLKANSRNHQTARTVKEKIQPSQASRSLKLPNNPKSEKPCTDQLHETKQNIGAGPSVPPQSSGNYQKQWAERKARNKGELVKYMSNLPGYLQRVERGENLQEKALNFGVLDWGRLEEWKYNQKQIPGRSSVHSSFPSHLASSSKETDSHSVKPSKGNASAFQDLKTVSNKTSACQQKLPATGHSFGKNYSEIQVEKVKGNDSDPKIIPEKKTELFEEIRLIEQHCPGKSKTIVLLLPRDSTKKSLSGKSQVSDSTIIDDGKPSKPKCKSFSDSFYINNEVQFMELCADIPHSHSLPYKDESNKVSDVKLCSSVNAHGTEDPFDVSHSIPCSDGSTIVRSKDKHTKENNSIMKSTKLTVHKASSKGSGLKAVEAKTATGRYPSPNHMGTVDLGLMGGSFSSKEVSSMPQLKSTYVTVRSGPVKPDASPCLDNSIGEKSNSNSRAKSSPLRRLLDPLLKPRAANHLQSAKPSRDESTSKQLDSCMAKPVERSLNFLSHTDVSHLDEKRMSLMVQAILKVTVKDGLPLFTFAVDNNDILAASLKKINTFGKNDCSLVYTFYSFQKTKKKSGGWINQGSKGKKIDYIPKIVGEMKVSSSQCGNIGNDSKDRFMVREFVLFNVEQKQVGEEINRELAAIVVKVPKESTEESHSCNSAEHRQSRSCVESQSLSSFIVILPGAVHSLPASGVPSSLINRWITGGSCDCGGWDVGCSLRILANKDQRSKNSSSSKDFCATDQFELFIQEGATQENRTVFSLSTIEKGIYSIDFNNSISSLQAFSICTAILDSRKLAELSEASNLLEDKISEEIILTENDRMKIPTQIDGNAPWTCLPFPPLSPVGRV